MPAWRCRAPNRGDWARAAVNAVYYTTRSSHRRPRGAGRRSCGKRAEYRPTSTRPPGRRAVVDAVAARRAEGRLVTRFRGRDRRRERFERHHGVPPVCPVPPPARFLARAPRVGADRGEGSTLVEVGRWGDLYGLVDLLARGRSPTPHPTALAGASRPTSRESSRRVHRPVYRAPPLSAARRSGGGPRGRGDRLRVQRPRRLRHDALDMSLSHCAAKTTATPLPATPTRPSRRRWGRLGSTVDDEGHRLRLDATGLMVVATNQGQLRRVRPDLEAAEANVSGFPGLTATEARSRGRLTQLHGRPLGGCTARW